jgi:hypothetical protein
MEERDEQVEFGNTLRAANGGICSSWILELA